MQKLRYGLIALSLLICSATSVPASVSIGIGLPNVSIGINLPVYPELVRVPGYPVYYAPQMDANYFFYDGMYWVYSDDNWYASSWYNGPWGIVGPEVVPLFILRVPVRYYRQPPVYFRGWQSNAPPRWDRHWGPGWERQRSGWNRWDRRSAPKPAPLPVYQRQYSGDRYPRVEQQHTLHSREYRYQPRDKVVREHFKQRVEHRAPAQQQRKQEPAARSPQRPDAQRPEHRQQAAPPGQHSQPQHRGDDNIQRSAPAQPAPQQRGPAVREQKHQPAPAQQREQQAPRVKEQGQRQQDRGESQVPQRDHGKGQKDDEGRGQGQRNDDDRGHGRNK